LACDKTRVALFFEEESMERLWATFGTVAIASHSTSSFVSRKKAQQCCFYPISLGLQTTTAGTKMVLRTLFRHKHVLA
jgi:hypothetical protein